MIRHKLLLLPAICLMAAAQSCVHGYLDSCPPMVNYAVTFSYTEHMGRGDRFYDDVKKINLYVFDESNLVYTTTTELSPYEENFNIPLELPSGNYHIIAWGNVLDDQPFDVTPSEFVKGETTFDEARLVLQKTADGLCDQELENLFYGELNVDVPLYLSKIDTMPLINDTKNIRVVLYWDMKMAAADQKVDYKDLTLHIEAQNGVFKFDNTITPTPVTYSHYKVDSTGKLHVEDPRPNAIKINYYPDELTKLSDSTVFDFKVLRFITDVPKKLKVLRSTEKGDENLFGAVGSPERWDPSYGKILISRNNDTEEGFTRALTEMNIRGNAEQQRALDRYSDYQVNVYFLYDTDDHTFVTGDIATILDWQYVEVPAGGGAD